MFWLKVLIIFTFALPVFSQEKTDVIVGGYVFPPFVQTKDEQWTGITLDLIDLLNKHQEKYNFVFKKTSSLRRYSDLESKKYDVIMFEDIKWGWSKSKVSSSQPFLKGGEVFITKKIENRDQSFFDNIKDKKILGYLGYHYQFADFNADPAYLNKNFDIKLSSSHEGNILSIKLNRADIAIVTKSMLSSFLKKKPLLRDELLISQKLDQEYNHTILTRNDGPISVEEIDRLVQELKDTKKLHKLWISYGIDN